MLKETLKKDEIAAMKARDKARVSVLRLVNSEIKSFKLCRGITAEDGITVTM